MQNYYTDGLLAKLVSCSISSGPLFVWFKDQATEQRLVATALFYGTRDTFFALHYDGGYPFSIMHHLDGDGVKEWFTVPFHELENINGLLRKKVGAGATGVGSCAAPVNHFVWWLDPDIVAAAGITVGRIQQRKNEILVLFPGVCCLLKS